MSVSKRRRRAVDERHSLDKGDITQVETTAIVMPETPTPAMIKAGEGVHPSITIDEELYLVRLYEAMYDAHVAECGRK